MRLYNPHMSLTAIASWVVVVALVGVVPVKAEKFSIVVLPDTQFYSENDPGTFQAQTNWIVDNLADGGTSGDPHPIIYVAHLGDLVNNDCNAMDDEWANAVIAMDILRTAGIPHGVLPGNHDFDNLGSGGTTDFFCQLDGVTTKYNGPPPRFGPGQYPNFPGGYYGGNYHEEELSESNRNDNNYTLFGFPREADPDDQTIKFIAINFSYSQDDIPAATLWADGLLKANPDRLAIITSHFVLKGGTIGDDCQMGTGFGDLAQDLWNDLSDNPNLFMMLGGHCDGEKWLRINPNEEGRSQCMGRVDVLMSNYQTYVGQNSGYMRIMQFDTDANTITVKTRSDEFSSIPVGCPAAITPVGGAGTDRCPNTTMAGMDDDSISDFTINYSFDPIRRPSVVLVQDVSGSMGWAIDGDRNPGPDEQRLDFAKEAAKEFLDLLQMAPAESGIVNVGITKFGGNTGESVFGLEVDTSSAIINAKGTIDALDASGGTPLVAGVETADTMLDEQTCRAVVLLSDGYHNVPNRASVGDAPITNLLTSLDTNTRIFSVAFGNTVEVDIPLLKELANETRQAGFPLDSQFFDATASAVSAGTSGSWSAPTGLSNAYSKILGDVLKLQSAADPFGRIGAGETQSFPIQVTEHDRKVTFHVSWATPQRRLLTFRVYDSSGNEVPPPGVEFPQGVKIVNGISYRIMSVDNEALRVSGRIGPEPWRLEVISNRRQTNEAEPFQYNVLMDSGLKMQAGITGTGHVVGDTVTLTAELREGRRPIPGLTEVTVTVTVPEDGRGNWLSINDVTAQQLAQIPAQQGDETFAPVVRKGRYLTDIAKVPFPGQKSPQVVRLFDDGTHGDVTAKDGRYTNRFANTRKEGTYSFYFQAKGPTQNGNRFTRERQVQTYLAVKPTSETIDIDAVRVAGADDQRFDVVVTPKDPYGNFLGPGHLGLVTVETEPALTTGDLRDNLDGSYTQTILVPPGTNLQGVPVTVTVGEAKKTESLADLIRGSSILSNFFASLHAGFVNPHGDLDTIADVGPTVTLDLLYRFNAFFGWDLRLGFSNFDGSGGHSDTNLYTVGTNLKYTLNPTAPVRVFLNGGGGLYVFDPGDVEAGVNIGLGLNIPINRRFSFEATYNYHNALTASETLHFDQFQLGVLASF